MELQQTLVIIMVCGKKDLQQTSLCAKVLGCRNLCYVINNKTGNVKYKRNILAPSRNLCCRGNSISVTYSKAVFAASGNQHAKFRRHYNVIFDLPCSAIFFHLTSQKARLSEKIY